MGVNRSTFLIDKDGIVRKIWHKVKPDEHADEVLQAVDELGLCNSINRCLRIDGEKIRINRVYRRVWYN